MTSENDDLEQALLAVRKKRANCMPIEKAAHGRPAHWSTSHYVAT